MNLTRVHDSKSKLQCLIKVKIYKPDQETESMWHMNVIDMSKTSLNP